MNHGNGTSDTNTTRWDFYVTTASPSAIDPSSLVAGITHGLQAAGSGDVYVEIIEDDDDEFDALLQRLEDVKES